MKATDKSALSNIMKAKFLLIISLLFCGATFAQNIHPGVRAGVSGSTIQGDAAAGLNQLLDKTDGVLQTSERIGFFGGVYADISLAPGFSVEPGLYYSQRGYDLKGSYNIKGIEFLGASAKASLQTHYIDLPVLLKADINGFQVFAGPQISYLVHADLKARAGLLGVNLLNKSFDATNQFNEWDVSLTGGVGYQFANGLNIMAAYEHGLMKADRNQNVHAFNRGVKVGLGFRL